MEDQRSDGEKVLAGPDEKRVKREVKGAKDKHQRIKACGVRASQGKEKTCDPMWKLRTPQAIGEAARKKASTKMSDRVGVHKS